MLMLYVSQYRDRERIKTVKPRPFVGLYPYRELFEDGRWAERAFVEEKGWIYVMLLYVDLTTST